MKLRKLPLHKRIPIAILIALVISTITWVIVAPIIYVPFSYLERFLGSDKGIGYWQALGTTYGLITWIIITIVCVWYSIKVSWWDSWEEDKIFRDEGIDPKQVLKTRKSFNKIGYVGPLGKPHKHPGIVLGTKNRQKTKDHELLVAVEDTYHVALLGPTGSGKSQIYNIPSIIHNLATEDDVRNGKIVKRIAPTIVVVDVKGELYSSTSAFAAKKGYKIHAFDTNKDGESLSFNPLYAVHDYWIEGLQQTKAGERALQTAKEMMENMISIVLELDTNDKGDAFWKHGEVRMLTGLIALMFDMYDAGKLTREQVSFATAFQITTNVPELVNLGKDFGKSEYYNLYLKQTVNAFQDDPNNKVAEGTMMGLQNKIKTFETYKKITSRDDFHLIDDSDKNIIYLKVPDHEPASYKIAALFIEQYYVSQVNKANKHHSKRAKRDVKVIWDELANFPRVETLPTITRMARSRGFQFFFSLQDRSSLEVKYGKSEADTIFKQCLAKVGLRVDTTDAKYFSDLVGLRKKKRNKSISTDKRGIGTSISEDMKEVIRADEIQDFRIMNASKDGISDAIVVTPRTKALIENKGWYNVSDHVIGALEDFHYDVVETYYNKGTPLWDGIWKEKQRKADLLKKNWDSKEWRKNFQKKWNLKHSSVPNSEEKTALMNEEMKVARKEFLESKGMIPMVSEVKEEIKNLIENLGSFDIEASQQVVDFKDTLTEIEIIGYSNKIKTTVLLLDTKIKQAYPEKYKIKGFAGRVANSIIKGFEKKQTSFNYIEEGYLILKEMYDLVKKDAAIWKNFHEGNQVKIFVEELEDKFHFQAKNEEVVLPIYDEIVRWVAKSNLKHKKPKSKDATKPSSLYIFLGNGKKVRISDHKSKTSGEDCDIEIIYTEDSTLSEVQKEYRNAIKSIS